MKKNTFRKSAIRTSFLAIVFSLALSFLPIRSQEAQAWDAAPAAILKQALEVAYANLQGVIMGAAKKQAAQALNDQINSLVGGSSTGNAKFITDWNDYLVTQPKNATTTYMNDYISQSFGGRGSSSYSSTSSGGTGYASQLQQAAKNSVNLDNNSDPKYDFSGDIDDVFKDGNMKNFGSLIFNPMNNPFGAILTTQGVYLEKSRQEEMKATTQAKSNLGFKGTVDSNGNVTYPGALMMQNMANTQDLGNKIIASAKSIPEVISAVVSQMVNKAVQNGIGQVSSAINREVNNVKSKVNSSINSAVSNYGPGALYR